MFFLLLRVCPGNHRSWLSHPEPKLTEKALALPKSQRDPVPRSDELGQSLAAPEVDTHPNIQWRLAKYFPNLTVLFILQAGRPSRSLQINKTRKPFFLKAVDPVFDCPGGISKQSPYFGATHPLCDEKNRMESVVVT
jgi:hypothetical protein